MSASFRIDASKLAGLAVKLRKGVVRGFTLALKMLEAITKQEEPKRTGRMKQSTIADKPVDLGNELHGTVTVTAKSKKGDPYPLFVEGGTGIYGPNARPIAMRSKSGKAYEVPGMKPNPYAERAVAKAEPRVAGEIEKGIRAAGL
jgi:hypothetical protein